MNGRQWAALFAIAGIWGSSFLFLRVLVTAGFEPIALSGIRTILGALCLLPFAYAARKQFPRQRSTWFALAVLGLANFAMPWTLFAIGQKYVPSGIGSVVNSAMPLWAAAFSALLITSERLSRSRIAGLLLGFCGVAILFAGAFADLGDDALLGIAPMVLATICYAISSVSIRRWLRHVPALPLTIGQLGFATLYLVPAALFSGGLGDVEMGWHEWGSVLLLGFAGSGGAVLLYMWLLQQVGAVRASVALYLMPPVGVSLGWLILDEPVGWNLAAGLATIIAGVALVQGSAPAATAALLRRIRSTPKPAEAAVGRRP